jgi:hypothetical protein
MGQDGVRQVLAFVTTHPEGISLRNLGTKFNLISDQQLLATVKILEEDGDVRVRNDNTVYPSRRSGKAFATADG